MIRDEALYDRNLPEPPGTYPQPLDIPLRGALPPNTAAARHRPTRHGITDSP